MRRSRPKGRLVSKRSGPHFRLLAISLPHSWWEVWPSPPGLRLRPRFGWLEAIHPMIVIGSGVHGKCKIATSITLSTGFYARQTASIFGTKSGQSP